MRKKANSLLLLSFFILGFQYISAKSKVYEFPSYSDSTAWWMLKGAYDCLARPYTTPTSKHVHFLLYTRNNVNEPEEIFLVEEHVLEVRPENEFYSTWTSDGESDFQPLNTGGISKSKWFNVLTETKVIIHGFLQNNKTEIILDMKNEYLKKDNYNVIIMDWSIVSSNVCYPRVVEGLPVVGQLLAQLLDEMVEWGASMNRVHIIGFSLGAHIAGHAGYEVQSGRVNRITGLDPASPFIPMEPKRSLSSGDAEFVDVIHTEDKFLGQKKPMGHVDFYPNGGSQQPGCTKSLISICSHARAVILFTESINNPQGFPASACTSWLSSVFGRCKSTLPMGDACPHTARGSYFLKTGSNPPYARL